VLTKVAVAITDTEKLLEGEWLWSKDGTTQTANIWLEYTNHEGKFCSFTEHRLKDSFDANKHTSIDS
jgi:hypothetical protein